MIRDDDGAPTDTESPIGFGAQLITGIALMALFAGVIWLVLTPH